MTVAVRLIAAVAALGSLPLSAAARDLTINDQQQQAIDFICEKSARSPANTLAEIRDLSTFCLNFRDLIARNNAQPPAPPPEAPKPTPPAE